MLSLPGLRMQYRKQILLPLIPTPHRKKGLTTYWPSQFKNRWSTMPTPSACIFDRRSSCNSAFTFLCIVTHSTWNEKTSLVNWLVSSFLFFIHRGGKALRVRENVPKPCKNMDLFFRLLVLQFLAEPDKSIPIAQMGNYQDYLKNALQPLRDLAEDAPKQVNNTFGNPWISPKKVIKCC